MQRTFHEVTRQDASDSVDLDAPHRTFTDSRGDLTWDLVLESRRVLLVAAAGAGKSYECERQADLLFERGESAFYMRLENIPASGVARLLRRKHRSRFNAWLASASQIGYFFVDSIDELQLVHGSFRAALERLAEEIEGALARAVIVVTSRPVSIDRQAFADILPVPIQPAKVPDGEAFVRIAMRAANDSDEAKPPETIKEFSLLPLDDRQIAELAREQGVKSPDKLLQEIDARSARDFARWPQELIELCDDWRLHGQIRPHYNQVESHVRAQLKARVNRREKADLSVDKAQQGVQRLALAVMLCRRWTLRYSANADVPGSGEEPVDPTTLLNEWNAPEIAALLERPLFGDGGYGRVRFRHRSVLEYLAACQMNHQITTGTLNLSAAKRLLFAMTDANELVAKPSMRPVAAWLALLRADVFEAVLKVDPGTLLIHGDPESLQPEQCEKALRAFVELHGKGQWRGLELPDVQVSRMARQPLGSVIVGLWRDGIENPEIRELLLRLVASGRYQDCADLAAAVSSDPKAGNAERFEAIFALAKLPDDRLGAVVESATSVAKGWPQVLGRWVGTRLFPEHVTDEQLLKLLGKLKRESRRELDYASNVARVVDRADLSTARLKALLPGLMALTRKLVSFNVDSDEVCEPTGQLKVSLILRSACARLLMQNVASDDVLCASVMAIRVASVLHEDRSDNEALVKLLAELPVEHRVRVFDAEYTWITERYPERTPRDVFVRLAFLGASLTYSRKLDWDWSLAALGDVDRDVECRGVLLQLAVYLATRKESKLDGFRPIRRAVANSASLTAQLEEMVVAARRPDPARVRMERRHEKQEKQRQRKTAEETKQWRKIWRMLATTPAVALAPAQRDSTIWNISLALRKKPMNQGEARWDRAFLQRHFGQTATDELRKSLMAYWRGLRPTVRRERKAGEKSTYLVVWTNALVGVYAEAEDPNWADRLSAEEAELATRYALLEHNGLPNWLVALAAAHPVVVERVIGEELDEELAEPAESGKWTSMLLQSVRYGRREIAQLIERRLVKWLRDARPLLRNPLSQEVQSKLAQVVKTLLSSGSEQSRRWLGELATREVSAAGDGPNLAAWLPSLCQINPKRGLDSLLASLGRLPVEKDGMAVQLIGGLFDDRRSRSTSLWSTKLTPDQRLRLVRAICRHVVPTHDNLHDGVYSPSSRDHAEDGRRLAFNELMATTGHGAMEAKLALAEDPAFADSRERITLVARERLASEIDASVFAQEELARMLGGRELTPKTGTDMAHLLVDRIDDLQELMLRDTSPRAAWAMVRDENSLRPAIARELETASRGAYTVDQEAVTADGKETDIRLRALSGHHATIELKVGEKQRSGKELRDAIADQLVLKYMAHLQARTGCLLVTVSDPEKGWDHPDTDDRMNRFQLQEMLDEAAQRAQQKLGGDARVLARVLDLTPRLPSEAKARSRRKASRSRRPAARRRS